MKQQSEGLIQEIEFFIKGEIINKDKTKEVIQRATQQKELGQYFKPLMLTKIFNLEIPFTQLTISELCNLTGYLQRVYSMKVNVSDWFTDTEIESATKETINIINESNNLVLENVQWNGSHTYPEFRCFVDYKKILSLSDKSYVTYNTAAQRIGEIHTRGIITVVRPTIYGDAVTNIAKLVSEEKFKSNDIILNIPRVDGTKPYVYSKENMTLTIQMDKTSLDVTDGAHRYYGIIKGLKEYNPNAEGYIGLTIMNLDIEDSANLVYQISLTNEHNRELITKYDQTNAITQFIKSLNTSYDEKSNFLYGKIDLFANNRSDAPFIKYELLRKAMTASGVVEHILNGDYLEQKKLKEYIIEFYTTFASIFADKKKNTMALESGMFICGLMYTVYEMYKNNKVVNIENITKMISKMNLDQTNYIFDYPLDDKKRKEMAKIFKALVKNTN